MTGVTQSPARDMHRSRRHSQPQPQQQPENEGGLDRAGLRGLGLTEQLGRLAPPEQEAPDTGGGQKKKGFKKGTELTKHKAGSKQAKQDYLDLMDGGDDFRVEKLKGLLHGRKSSKNQLFYHLQMIVSGDNGGLEAAYEKAVGTKLRNDLAQKLGEEQLVYVMHCIRLGEPQLEDRIMLALGKLTGTASDSKEVIYLFEEAKDEVKLRVWSKMGGLIEDELGEKGLRLGASVEMIKAKAKKEEDDKNGVGGVNGAIGREADMLVLADRELVAIVKGCFGKLALKRDKLAEVLPKWASKQSQQTRDYVLRQGSLFMTELKGAVGLLFTKSDLQYVVEMVEKAKPVEDSFFQDDKETDQLEGKAKEKRVEARQEEGSQTGELQSYMDRKTRDNSGVKTLGIVKDRDWRWATLKEKIEEMSPEQKDHYLYSLMGPTEQQVWLDEATPFSVKQALRLATVEGPLRDKLKAMGMTGGGNATKLRKKLQDTFKYGANANTMTGGGTFRRLLSHSKEEMAPEAFGKKALALIRKVRGEEFAQIRGDQKLMKALETQSSPKYWGYIAAALGLSVGAHDRAEGGVDKDLLNGATVTGEQKHERDDAQRLGAEEAEFLPSHWGALLTAALKHARLLRRTEINSLVTRAFMAGKRREAATKDGEVQQSGDRKLRKMGADEFVRAVFDSVSSGAKAVLEANKQGKLKNAYLALMTGTRPSVDEQLEDVEFRSPLKKTSGEKANKEKVETLFEDLQGKDLLDEWSNIEEYRELYQQTKIAIHSGDQDKAGELVTCLNNFVIDIRDDRRADLKRLLSKANFVKSQNALRKKLVGAMKSDSEAVGYLEEIHFLNDELSQARTKNLALSDEQRMRSTGAQYNTFLGGKSGLKNPLNGKQIVGASASSAETKESMGMVLGRTRKAQSEVHKGDKDRGQVVKDNAKGIQDSQKDLERRGASFDKMRKSYNKIVMGIVKGLVTLVIAAAMAALTVATGGLGGIAGVGVLTAKILLKQTVGKLVQAQLEGDSFNTTKAVWDVAFATLIAAAGGAIGAFAVPEILGAMGEGVMELGDGITSTTEFVAPTDIGQAAYRTALEKGMKVGFKGLMKTAITSARSTDDNPALGKIVAGQLGGLALNIGGAVGASALTELNTDLVEKNGTADTRGGNFLRMNATEQNDELEERSTQYGAQLSGHVSKGGRQMYKNAKALFGPEEMTHGKDLPRTLGFMIPGALRRADDELAELWKRKKDLDEGQDSRELDERIRNVRRLRFELESRYQSWQREQAKNGKDEELNEMSSSAVPVFEAMSALDQELNKEA